MTTNVASRVGGLSYVVQGSLDEVNFLALSQWSLIEAEKGLATATLPSQLDEAVLDRSHRILTSRL